MDTRSKKGRFVAFNHIRVRERRQELNLSQFDVSALTAKTGKPIRPDYLSKIESGHKNPGRTKCFQLAAALQIDPSELEKLESH